MHLHFPLATDSVAFLWQIGWPCVMLHKKIILIYRKPRFFLTLGAKGKCALLSFLYPMGMSKQRVFEVADDQWLLTPLYLNPLGLPHQAPETYGSQGAMTELFVDIKCQIGGHGCSQQLCKNPQWNQAPLPPPCYGEWRHGSYWGLLVTNLVLGSVKDAVLVAPGREC